MDNLPAVSEFPSKELALVHYISTGIGIENAVKIAGFAKFPHTLLSSPAFLSAIEKAWRGQIKLDLADCRKVLADFVRDSALAPKTRIKAAEVLHAWISKDPELSGKDKALSELSGDELSAEIKKLQRELGARAVGAKVIDAPTNDIGNTHALDILG